MPLVAAVPEPEAAMVWPFGLIERWNEPESAAENAGAPVLFPFRD
jgi:hypothetical protein